MQLAASYRRARMGLIALALLVSAPACATLEQIGALRRVTFDYDRMSGVRLAGVALDGRDAWSDLTTTDIARLAAAIAAREAPFEAVVHLRAENPQDQTVTARLLALDWRFFVEDRRLLSGRNEREIALPPGQPTDVPVTVALDLYDAFGGSSRDLLDLALAIAGKGPLTREVRLELEPEINTAIGPIRYPTPIVVRRGGDQ
jgi:hypothetical protein